jgi:hypothetical protein
MLDGTEFELQARRLYLLHRLSDVVDDERDHNVGVVGNQPDVPMPVGTSKASLGPSSSASPCGRRRSATRHL